MTSYQSNFSSPSKDLSNLWREWALAFGAPIVVIILSLFISKTWLPVIVLAGAWLMRVYSLGNHYYQQRRCLRMVHLSSTVLIISAIIMLGCVAVTRGQAFGLEVDLSGFNERIPYIVALIVFPVMVVMMGKALLFDKRSTYCRGCVMHSDFVSNECEEAETLECETRYQERLMLWLSALISVMNWGYYFLFYINVNLNTPDRFYFVIAPSTIYVLSLVLLGQRYFVMTNSYTLAEAAHHEPHTTLMRYLVMRGDEMLLNLGEDEASYPYDISAQADTPAVVERSGGRKPTIKDATEAFAKISGADAGSFTIKRLYSEHNRAHGLLVVHYAVVMNAEEPLPATWHLGDDWARLDEINRRLNMGVVSPTLAGEMKRIFTMTMAWKTYTREGRRIYPIRNYRPTFRLRDFKDWTLDYADPIWLHVAVDNEDKPMWRIRRLMRKVSRKLLMQR